MTTKETPKNPEHMQRLFETVKQLKCENYMGTAQILASIKGREEFKKNAKKISDGINSNLKRLVNAGEFPAITCPATPERVVGILEGIRQIEKYSYKKWLKNHKDTNLGEFIPSFMARDIIENILGFNIYCSPVSILGGDFTPLVSNSNYFNKKNQKEVNFNVMKVLFPAFCTVQSFVKANGSYLDTDGDLGVVATRLTFFGFLIKNEELQLVDKAIERIDFNALLSSKNMLDMELSIGRPYMYPEEKFDAVFRDGINHRLEIKREMLSDYLLRLADYGKRITYGEVLEDAILRCSVDIDDVDTRNNEYLLHLVRTEKPFIENFLRS